MFSLVFFSFPWNIALNSFIMRLPDERVIAPIWKITQILENFQFFAVILNIEYWNIQRLLYL